jgi:hypothetical protein
MASVALKVLGVWHSHSPMATGEIHQCYFGKIAGLPAVQSGATPAPI